MHEEEGYLESCTGRLRHASLCVQVEYKISMVSMNRKACQTPAAAEITNTSLRGQRSSIHTRHSCKSLCKRKGSRDTAKHCNLNGIQQPQETPPQSSAQLWARFGVHEDQQGFASRGYLLYAVAAPRNVGFTPPACYPLSPTLALQ